MDVAPAALAALGEQFGLAVFGQVGDDFAVDVIDDQGTDRHAQVDIVRALAVAIRAAAWFAVAPVVGFRIAKIDQRVDVPVRNRPDRAALAAVAAVRTAEGAELLAQERGATVAAVARNDFNSCFVDKLHF
jgi:hypothetical protein